MLGMIYFWLRVSHYMKIQFFYKIYLEVKLRSFNET